MTAHSHLRDQRISRPEARGLYLHSPLAALGELANEQRFERVPGNTVTYLIDRNINYTNICNTDCQFCAFYRRASDDPESYVNSKAVLGKKIEEAIALGATRVLMQGGHNDALPFEYYVDLVRWIDTTYDIEINAFSPPEIEQMHKISGKSFHAILEELQAAGLDGLPGGGAEILDDEVRKRVSPKKTSADCWIEIMEAAHELSLTTTATMVIGFGETIEQRLNHLERLRALQDRSLAKGHRGFVSFISWTLQLNEDTAMGRSRRIDEFGASSTEYLRNAALCRLYLDNIIHHQASWPTMGPQVAQVALHFGCDDFGSTMIEENVVSQAGAPNQGKWSMSPEEIRRCITKAGFTPMQRDSSYHRVRPDADENAAVGPAVGPTVGPTVAANSM